MAEKRRDIFSVPFESVASSVKLTGMRINVFVRYQVDGSFHHLAPWSVCVGDDCLKEKNGFYFQSRNGGEDILVVTFRLQRGVLY